MVSWHYVEKALLGLCLALHKEECNRITARKSIGGGGGGRNMRNLEWRNLVGRKFGPTS